MLQCISTFCCGGTCFLRCLLAGSGTACTVSAFLAAVLVFRLVTGFLRLFLGNRRCFSGGSCLGDRYLSAVSDVVFSARCCFLALDEAVFNARSGFSRGCFSWCCFSCHFSSGFCNLIKSSRLIPYLIGTPGFSRSASVTPFLAAITMSDSCQRTAAVGWSRIAAFRPFLPYLPKLAVVSTDSHCFVPRYRLHCSQHTHRSSAFPECLLMVLNHSRPSSAVHFCIVTIPFGEASCILFISAPFSAEPLFNSEATSFPAP